MTPNNFVRGTGFALGLILMCAPTLSSAWYMPYMAPQGHMYAAEHYAFNPYTQFASVPYSYAPAYPSYGSISLYQPTYSYAPFLGQQLTPGPYNANGSPRYPYSYGVPTGDTVPLIGGSICYYADYGGRAPCDSDPMQRVYDPWTGSWY